MKLLVCTFIACCLTTLQVSAQSLAEAARREAERRRQLSEQGVEAKVIDKDSLSQPSSGAVTTFKPGAAQKNLSGSVRETKTRTSAGAYRSRLQRLDREILEYEEKQILLRRQADADKWTLPKSGRRSGATEGQTLQEKLRKQADDLGIKLKSLRRQRQETWGEGRKAGYLPGELDGKGVSP